MAITGQNLLTGLSQFMGDDYDNVTSATSTDGTTVVKNHLSAFGEDYFRDYYVRITQSGTNQYHIRRVKSFASASGTLTVDPAFPAVPQDGDAFEIHRYEPSRKFTALDEARLRAYPEIAKLVFDETITGDGYSREFDIPSAIRKGPVFAFIEYPLGTHDGWNFLSDPDFDSTSNWAASSVTASIVTEESSNKLIPKYDNSCTKLVVAASTAGTYSQVVANMNNDITAAGAAGQKMTFAAWVYSRVASKIRIQLIDDSGTTSSSYHGGAGWELITVEKNIVGNSSSLLTARIEVANNSTTFTGFIDRGWLYFGDAGRVRSIYPIEANARVRRDDTTQRIMFDNVPQARRQIRLVGRSPISALGTTRASQVTNTMEVDEPAAMILYAHATQILFEREGIYSDMPEEISAKLSIIQERASEYETKFPFRMLAGSKLQGPFKV